jgi:lipopolysaccharide/colanic/teichoic acid biosynthesis glycosyltransferase
VSTSSAAASDLRDRLGALGGSAGTLTGWPSPDDGDLFARLRWRARLLTPPEAATSAHPEWAHRVVNVVVALVGLVVLAPLCLVVALVIKLTSAGPVIYSQTRVGLDRRGRYGAGETSRRAEDLGGRVFTMYKFRTMRCDAEAAGEAVWAQKDDPRVTSIGRVLRKFRLDEVPQLWNVLTGDMNIVGPRPERPSIFLTLRSQVEDYQIRQRVRPGITGWAQINQAYDSSIDDVKRKVQLDLEYIRERSVWRDILIMCRTIPVMLGRKGAH